MTTIVAEKSVLYSGANDFMVKKWNISNGDLLKDLSAHTYFVSSVRLDEIYLFSSSFDQTIRLWDKESDVLVRSYTCNLTMKTNVCSSSTDLCHLHTRRFNYCEFLWR